MSILCNLLSSEPKCGFPSIPDFAQVHGYSWDSYQLEGFGEGFNEGFQMNFSCQTGSGSFNTTNGTKTCKENGTWIGQDLECHQRMSEPFKEIIFNSSSFHIYDDSLIFNKEIAGEILLVAKEIFAVGFIEIQFEINSHGAVNSSHLCLPQVIAGRHNCTPENELRNCNSSTFQVKYYCSSKAISQITIYFFMPTKIRNLTAYGKPKPKCYGRPEIPLYASAKMEGSYTVRYRCRDSFHLIGNETISCNQSSGLWPLNPPKCEKISNAAEETKVEGPSNGFEIQYVKIIEVFTLAALLVLAMILKTNHRKSTRVIKCNIIENYLMKKPCSGTKTTELHGENGMELVDQTLLPFYENVNSINQEMKESHVYANCPKSSVPQGSGSQYCGLQASEEPQKFVRRS